MACTNCSQTRTVANPCTTGCATTINTDCVIYDDEPLCFEDEDVEDGDKRTLTSLLQEINCSSDTESKILAFHADGETGNGDAYTVLAEDTTKILLLTFTDDGESGTFTNTITLPQTADFINKEILIKDISAVTDDQNTFINYEFNIQIQYGWNPLATSNAFYDLADPVHKTLRLKFVKVTEVSYQWLVVSNSFTGDLTTYTETVTLLNDWEDALGYPVRIHRKGNEVKFSGAVKNGENSTQAFLLPVNFRPSFNMTFIVHCTDGDSTGWAEVLVNTTGVVSVGAYGIAGGITLDGSAYLSGINYYIT